MRATNKPARGLVSATLFREPAPGASRQVRGEFQPGCPLGRLLSQGRIFGVRGPVAPVISATRLAAHRAGGECRWHHERPLVLHRRVGLFY
jgi:hypothetical protein